MNQDLQSLHTTLVGCVIDLAHAQEEATTVEAVKTIGLEIDAMSHRATVVGQLLFKQQTAKITAAVAAVDAATVDLNKAIEEIENFNNFIMTVTGFLKLVDKVIAIAKLV